MSVPVYGLDAELKAKQEANYDPELERDVCDWISKVTGETRDSEMTVCEWLRDGVILCNLVNKIHPGQIPKISHMKAPFKKMENITHFTDAARTFGVNEAAMFATPDLYEEKNMGSVINCIYTFAGVIQSTAPEYTGPSLGKLIHATKVDQRRSKKIATQTGGLSGTIDHQRGFTSKRDAAAADPNAALVDPDAQGLDADLKKKMAEKFDPELDKEVCAWIQDATGKSKGDASTADWLKDGQVLCALANRVEKGAITNVNTSSLAFKQMENISHFTAWMRKIGMAESALFSTPDLYEEKNLGIVITSLYALGGVIQANCPEYTGPQIGHATHAEILDKSRGLGLVTDQNEAMNRHLEVERPKDGLILRGEDRMD